MNHPKIVQLHLKDGTPTGRIKASLGNWIGEVFLIPRVDIKRPDNNISLKQSGVYLLLGKSSKTGRDQIYVGQGSSRINGNGVLGRVEEHMHSPSMEYFTQVIAITTSNNSLGATEISYLENALYSSAKKAGRADLMNRNIPSTGNPSEEKQAMLDEFLSNAMILIGTLGCQAFNPVDPHQELSGIVDKLVREPDAQDLDVLLYLNSSGARGTGRQTPEGFVVLKGAKLQTIIKSSMKEHLKRLRKDYKGRIHGSTLLKDTLFDTPSAAAGFLTGTSVNGRVLWKNSLGQSLKDMES